MVSSINSYNSGDPSTTKINTSDISKSVSNSMAACKMETLQNYIESNETSLDITVDQTNNTIIVKVISDYDGKVIREIPFEHRLDLSV
jgi:uncharacterized FlaG/YvyC family protein